MLNTRFVTIRKHFKLTQSEFGQRLGTSRDAIANIEYGRVEPSQMIVKLVCKEFGINEYWLETGNGSMFREVSDIEKAVDFYMSALAGGNTELDTFKQVFVKELAALLETFGADGWAALQTMIRNTYEAQKKKGQD